MSYEKEFDALIEFLKNLLELPELIKDDENTCTLVSEQIVMTLYKKADNLLFITNFGSLQECSKKEYIQDYLLAANVLFYSTNGGTFGISEEGLITFTYKYPMVAMTNEVFVDLLDRYLITVAQYKEVFAKIEHTSEINATSNTSSDTLLETQLIQQHWQKV